MGKNADFQEAPIGRWPFAGGATHNFDPTIRGERQVHMLVDPFPMQDLVGLDQVQRLDKRAILGGWLQLQQKTQAEQQ